jgi:hypothetical protein
MTCGFCAKEARDRAFTGHAGLGLRPDYICYDCVRELYVAMIAPEMQPPRPPRFGRRRGARGVRLYPRRGS